MEDYKKGRRKVGKNYELKNTKRNNKKEKEKTKQVLDSKPIFLWLFFRNYFLGRMRNCNVFFLTIAKLGCSNKIGATQAIHHTQCLNRNLKYKIYETH